MTPFPRLLLAPMQDVTDLPFMRLMGRYGAPDTFITEYFRVHIHSTPEPHILDAVRHHGTNKPVHAQLIGEDLFHIERTVRLLLNEPIAGIDLNMGCPAPKVYKKHVGGGLLRDLEKVDELLGHLRAICPTQFSVKTRIGFSDSDQLPDFLALYAKHRIDFLSLHGRTVEGLYRSEVDYSKIKQAASALPCPVYANGDIDSPEKALAVLLDTQAAGVMIGRAAIRNPWIFRQCREYFAANLNVFIRENGLPGYSKHTEQGETSTYYQPTLADVRHYLNDMWETTYVPKRPERSRLNKMKKLTNFVGQGVDPDGAFLKDMRRTDTPQHFFEVADTHLLAHGKGSQPFACKPFPGVWARPNHENPDKPGHVRLTECRL